MLPLSIALKIRMYLHGKNEKTIVVYLGITTFSTLHTHPRQFDQWIG
jgi:hypothetical protein